MRGKLLVLAMGVAALVGSWIVMWAMWRYQELARDVAWLEDRRFDALALVTVGTGSAYENPRRLGPVGAVGFGPRIVLVDAGRGAAEALRACAIRTSQPDTVVLTSLLPENTVGLDDLVASAWLASRQTPLRVIGPPGTRALAASLESAHAAGRTALADALGVPEAGARLEAVDAGDGFGESRDGLSLRAATVGARPLPSLAWRFEAGGGSLVVSGSGPEPDALAAAAAGAGLLLTEGFFRASAEMAIAAGDADAQRLRREANLHLPLEEAGRVAARAGVPLLVLSRLRPPPLFAREYRRAAAGAYRGQVAVAADCDEFTRRAR
jgi:ribonuclease BN (tRNA processing enzyme)